MEDYEIRHIGGLDYPLINPKTFRSGKTGYELNCERLKKGLCNVFHYNEWLDSVDKPEYETLLSTICVEFRFLHMVNCIKTLYEWHTGRLLNIRQSFFMDLLHQVGKRMQTLMEFVHKSHRLLREMLTEDDSLTAHRNELVEEFRKQTDWLYAITAKEETHKMANTLFKKEELNYNPALFITQGDSFSDHSVAVMNGLIVLSLPTTLNRTDDEYVEMFDKSYQDFLRSKEWQCRWPEWALEVDNKCEIFVQNELGTKKEYLKSIWNRVYRCEDELLRKFGIQHVNVAEYKGKAIMGRRLYESLNRKARCKDSETPSMTDTDLQEYFIYLAEKQYLTEEIDKLQTSNHPPSDEHQQKQDDAPEKAKSGTSSKKSYMRHESDKDKLITIMRDANNLCLDGQHICDEGSHAWKDYHVALCLFFYLRVSNNAVPGLFSGFCRAFYNSFDKKEFTTMRTYEQFHKTLVKLNEANFKTAIHKNKESEVDDLKIGHSKLSMWYNFYHRLLPTFILHLPPRSLNEDNKGYVKLT